MGIYSDPLEQTGVVYLVARVKASLVGVAGPFIGFLEIFGLERGWRSVSHIVQLRGRKYNSVPSFADELKLLITRYNWGACVDATTTIVWILTNTQRVALYPAP